MKEMVRKKEIARWEGKEVHCFTQQNSPKFPYVTGIFRKRNTSEHVCKEKCSHTGPCTNFPLPPFNTVTILTWQARNGGREDPGLHCSRGNGAELASCGSIHITTNVVHTGGQQNGIMEAGKNEERGIGSGWPLGTKAQLDKRNTFWCSMAQNDYC